MSIFSRFKGRQKDNYYRIQYLICGERYQNDLCNKKCNKCPYKVNKGEE